MRARFSLFALLVVSTTSVGCMEDHRWYRADRDGNDIFFGIEQTVDATGVKHVVANYEFLGLANKGGWVTQVFRDGDGDGTCYFERFDHRLGKPHVESGVATFAGGQLPSTGLMLLANQAEPTKLEAAGWSTGEMLTFDASGFAMPSIRPIRMTAPRVELEVTAVTPATAPGADLALKPTDSVGVTWAPIAEDTTHVMVALVTEEANGPGGEVRCFGSGASGSVVIPNQWVARLFSSIDPAAPIKGRLEVASHRQATIRARAGWTVYVVASTVVRSAAFTGSR